MTYPSYGTRSELKFIREIGRNQRHALLRSKTRLQLLENYRKALELRSDWKGIDKKQVVKFLDWQIKRAKNGK